MPWTRSETISSFALVISILSACVSLFQANIARRKERAETEAKKPFVEGTLDIIENRNWPHGWAMLDATVRNRGDYSIRDAKIEILEPWGVTIDPGVRSRRPVIDDDTKAPDIPKSLSADTAGYLGPAGSTREVRGQLVPEDKAEVFAYLFIPSSLHNRASVKLRFSFTTSDDRLGRIAVVTRAMIPRPWKPLLRA